MFKKILFFGFFLLFINQNIYSADKKIKEEKNSAYITTANLPYKTSLNKDYLIIISKGFDELDVIETYTFDVYSNSEKQIVISETYAAKDLPTSEFSLPDNTKLSIKSELTESYENYVAVRNITLSFYFKEFEKERLVVQFTFRKMY